MTFRRRVIPGLAYPDILQLLIHPSGGVRTGNPALATSGDEENYSPRVSPPADLRNRPKA